MRLIASGRLTITGTVIPFDWDRHGEVIAVSLITDSCEKYVVAESQKGSELLKLRFQEVKATGTIIGEDSMNNKIIEVTDYKNQGLGTGLVAPAVSRRQRRKGKPTGSIF